MLIIKERAGLREKEIVLYKHMKNYWRIYLLNRIWLKTSVRLIFGHVSVGIYREETDWGAVCILNMGDNLQWNWGHWLNKKGNMRKSDEFWHPPLLLIGPTGSKQFATCFCLHRCACPVLLCLSMMRAYSFELWAKIKLSSLLWFLSGFSGKRERSEDASTVVK